MFCFFLCPHLEESYQGDLTAVEKDWYRFYTEHFMCLEKVLATDSSDLPAAHTYPPSTVIKKSCEKAQKESRDLNSEDVGGRTCKANTSEY